MKCIMFIPVMDQPVLPWPCQGGRTGGVGTQVRSGDGILKVPGCSRGV